MLGLGLSGIPFTGPDVGGFSGSPSAELYIRWLQMASFLPFFRTHSSVGTPRREPWVYGDPFTTIARQVLKNRYRLLPYLYTSAWQTCQSGIPMARPLFWLDPNDDRLRRCRDAFLLGDSLLVAPMLEEGGVTRDLTLPAGTRFNLWDNSRLEGPAQVTLSGPVDRIPVLVRGGSIIPKEEDGLLVLRAYPIPGENQSHVYEDAGDGYGPYRVDHYSMSLNVDWLNIHCESQGDYQGANVKFRIIVHSADPNLDLRDLIIDGHKAAVQGNQFDCTPFKDMTLRFNSAG